MADNAIRVNDRWLKSSTIKPGRYRDKTFPGFWVRVTPDGGKTFLLIARFPGTPVNPKTGKRNPGTRALGRYPAVGLADAHEKARRWLKLIDQGKDPAVEDEKRRGAEDAKRKNTLAAVAEDFIAKKLPTERRGHEIENAVRREFIGRWSGRPITDIVQSDIDAVIKAKIAEGHPTQARNLLRLAKRFFSWAKYHYDLPMNPVADLQPKYIAGMGVKVARDRALSDDELFAFWRAVTRIPYPYGPIYRLLLLTGLRLNEVADMARSELHPAVQRALRQRRDDERIDWSRFTADQRTWIIPSARMKGRPETARAHAVPLTTEMLEILEGLPQLRCDYLFTVNGKNPVWVGDKVKHRLDARMLRTLKAMARRAGEDPHRIKLTPWRNHDLRRNVRSGLSGVKVEEVVREAVLAHVRPGITKNYDVHDYLDEKRAALVAWSEKLHRIVEPAPPRPAHLRLVAG